MKKGIIRIINLLIIVFLLVLAIDLSFNMRIRENFKAHFTRYDLVDPEDNLVLLSDNQYFTIEDASVLDQLKAHEATYVPLSWLKQFDVTGHYDSNNQILNLASRQDLVSASSEKTSLNLSTSDERLDWELIQGQVFVNLDQLIQWQIVTGSDLKMIHYDGGTVIINQSNVYKTESPDKRLMYSSFDQAVERQNQNRGLGIKDLLMKEKISAKADKGEILYWVPINDTIAYAASDQDHFGYVFIDAHQKEAYDQFLETHVGPLPASGDSNPKINLIWEAIYNVQPDTETIPDMGQMNVVSPTWYELKDESGAIDSKFNQEYLNWAHSRNYDVWALVTNQFDPDLTHQLLGNANSRRVFIENMVTEAVKHGFEGINIDFENIYLEDKDNLTHFVNELSWYSRQYDLILSMDVTVMDGSDNWSKCYDRQALGKIVDYLIIMTYDEYWASSPISGPVSSADWVESSLNKIMNIVPKDKIVMGIPLYTRMWRERISETEPNQNKTSSASISMTRQNQMIEEAGLTPLWDEQNKLYYISYFEDDSQVKLWIENTETIAYKIDIARRLDLGGIAFWRRGFETENFWNQIQLLEN